MQCGDQSRFLKVTNTVNKSNVNCTGSDTKAATFTSRAYYIRKCASFMAKKFQTTFKEGTDGHITRVDSVFVNTCERGDVYKWIDYGVCCPGNTILFNAFISVQSRPNDETHVFIIFN